MKLNHRQRYIIIMGWLGLFITLSVLPFFWAKFIAATIAIIAAIFLLIFGYRAMKQLDEDDKINSNENI
jgi:membrane protein implicated in regulation of membrane protease activity